MLTQQRAETVLQLMKSLDVSQRLEGIQKAQSLFHEMFSPEMTDAQIAESAMVIEQFYNIIRQELKVSQIRIRKDTEAEPKPVKEKSKKSKAPSVDVSQLMVAFGEWKKGQESK